MKKLLISAAAVVAMMTSVVSAQETGFGFGPKAGIGIASTTGGDVKAKVGLTVGAFADYRFSKLFALSADVLYARQGGKVEDTKLNTDYLNVPILANFYVVKGLAIKAGIQPGFLLGAKAKSDEGTMDLKSSMKSFDVAVPVGLSYTFNCGLILDARYNIGITKLPKEGDAAKNSVISITAGWRF